MNETMTAAVSHGAKDLRLEPRRGPELKPGFVLLRTRRVGICGSDLHYYEHGFCAAFVRDRPFVLGHELTADVAALGEGATGVKVGERVTVNPARACGSVTTARAAGRTCAVRPSCSAPPARE